MVEGTVAEPNFSGANGSESLGLAETVWMKIYNQDPTVCAIGGWRRLGYRRHADVFFSEADLNAEIGWPTLSTRVHIIFSSCETNGRAVWMLIWTPVVDRPRPKAADSYSLDHHQSWWSQSPSNNAQLPQDGNLCENVAMESTAQR